VIFVLVSSPVNLGIPAEPSGEYNSTKNSRSGYQVELSMIVIGIVFSVSVFLSWNTLLMWRNSLPCFAVSSTVLIPNSTSSPTALLTTVTSTLPADSVTE